MEVSQKLRTYFLLTIVLMNVGCDQISKEMIRNTLIDNEIVNVIHEHVILTKVENTGAALSLGSDLSPLLKLIILQILPASFLLFLLWMILHTRIIPKDTVIGICFVIGGGIGNIYDRFLYGSVTDFIYLEIGFFRTGIFNMADVSVFIGTIIIIYNIFKARKNEVDLEVNE